MPRRWRRHASPEQLSLVVRPDAPRSGREAVPPRREVPITSAPISQSHEGPAVTSHIPPGAPADIGLDVDPELMADFADNATTESINIGELKELPYVSTVEGAVPGAQLINGCIGVRQTLEPLIDGLYEELGQLYLDIHGGLTTIIEADETNAAALGEAGCR